MPEPAKPVIRKTYSVYRSAVTGHYVTKEFARTHPDITVKEKAHNLACPKRAKYARPVAIGTVAVAALLALWLVAVMV